MPIFVDLIAVSGETVQANLDRMQPRHIEDFETVWQEMLQNLNQYDIFWNWAMKKLKLSNREILLYSLKYSGKSKPPLLIS
jgi:hypothetical protein